MKSKFYVDAETNDDKAYQLAMSFACELSKKDNQIERIVLFISTIETTGWFNRIFGPDTVKQLFKGHKFTNCPVPFKFETKLTYKEFGNASDIVITCGIDSEDLFKIDDYYSVKYIIAVPWLRELTEKWIRTWDADEISGKTKSEKMPEPSPIIKIALQHLTRTINLSTGITHPSDNERAKTFIRALHKYEPELNPDIVGAYLIKELSWHTKHAKEIEKLIETLNNGLFFKGGAKTGLKEYYKQWEQESK
ncbi:MAG TPA: hypothetical protein VMV77_04985 [Bacteroidales bacterium]|nr:hypothetical protein [Bacteroidales bacterium]